MKIALATCEKVPALTEDDQLLAKNLSQRGHSVMPVTWNSPNADWTAFDITLIRSTWDYHLRPREFHTWLDDCTGRQVPMLNPAPLIQWNMHKSYLCQLGKNGIPVVDTHLIPRHATARLEDVMDELGLKKCIVKPAISATAHRTRCITRGHASMEQDYFDELVADSDVLVQPFVPEIQTDGEISLMYFGGEFSHAILKRAAQNDFRVQGDFGGTVHTYAPADTLLSQAAGILSAIPGNWLYARVDGVVKDNVFLLMELELIEPQLFFKTNDSAATLFASKLETLCADTPAPVANSRV
ncbi:MAG: hypothetical protein MJA83_14775 [Gammaproteobacteria bacterium]|nr:hypothetical protein [Gammaproteobacteria bacterium]